MIYRSLQDTEPLETVNCAPGRISGSLGGNVQDGNGEKVMIGGLNVTAAISEIKDQGYTVIPDFLSAQEVARIREAFNTEVPITQMRAIGTETGKTWRAHNLLAKTRAVDHLFLDPRLRAIVDGVIGKRSQVNITTLFNILPGETRQLLHQDDGLWPIPRPHPPFLCNALIAFDDFDDENGATHLVPGSHLWHHLKVDQSVATRQISMKSGSMLMWEGAMWHAGGANESKDRERMGLFMSHGVWYLRPQEIQLVSVPRDIARTMPRLLQQLIGYHRFGIGVDGRDPIEVLNDGVVVSPEARTAAEWRSDPEVT